MSAIADRRLGFLLLCAFAPAAAADDPAPRRAPRIAAVVVGIADHPAGSRIPPSAGAARDATRFAAWLREEGGWAAEDVLLLTDSGAAAPKPDLKAPGKLLPTVANLRNYALGRWLDARLGTDCGADDLVVLYFAGQSIGLVETRDGMDVRRGYPLAIDGRWALDEALDGLEARGVSVVCLLDTSMGGRGSGPVPGGDARTTGDVFLRRLTRRPRVSAWLAAAEGPAAVARSFSENSPFTEALLRGLGKSPARRNLVACLGQMRADPHLSAQHFAAVGNLSPRHTLWAADVRRGGHPAELLLQRGHSELVTQVAYSPAGDLLFTAGRDSTVRAWRPADGKLLRALAPHYRGINALAVSPDGRLVVAGDGDGKVRVWDHARGEALATRAAGKVDIARDAAFVADTPRFVTRDETGEALLWTPDADGLRYTARSISADTAALAAAAHPGPVGFVLAATSANSPASRLLPFGVDGSPLPPFDGPGGDVKSATLATDGRYVAAADAEGRALLRDMAKDSVILSLQLDKPVASIALAGGRLAVAEARQLFVFDFNNDVSKVTIDLEVTADRVVLSPDGRRLAALVTTAAGARGAMAWDLAGAGGPRPIALGAIEPGVLGVAFSPDGSTLAAGCQDGSIRTWSLADGTPGRSLPRSRGRVASLGSGNNGKRLLQMTYDGDVYAWDLPAGGAPRPLRAGGARRPNEWYAATATPGGDRAYLTERDRGGIAAFSLSTGRPLPDRLDPPPGLRLGRAVVPRDPASTRVAAAIRGRASAVVWDAPGLAPRTLDRLVEGEDELADLDLSPDGTRLLAAGKRGSVAVVDPAGVAPPLSLKLAEEVVAARFLPGKPLRVALAVADRRAAGGVRSRLRLWVPGEAASAALGGEVDGLAAALATSADGRWLALAADRAIEVWDLQGPRPRNLRLSPRPNHLERVTSLVLQADPPMVVSGGDDAQVRFWPLAGPRPAELLGSLVIDQDTGGWVAYTPQLDAPAAPGRAALGGKYLRFDSSIGGEIGVTWVQGDEVRNLEQYGHENRLLALTDLFRRGVAPGPPEDPPRRDAEPPRVAIEPPAAPAVDAAEARLRISLGARPLQDLRLYQNLVPVEVDPRSWQGRSEVSVPVHLARGPNRFYAMASAEGALDGRSNEVDLAYRGAEDAPRLHILALGVGEYQDEKMRLRYSAKDARDFAAQLRGAGEDAEGPSRLGHFGVLVDAAITEKALDAQFEALVKATRGRPQDRVVLFLAGHTDVEGRVFSLLLPAYKELGPARGGRLTLASLYRGLTRLGALSRAIVVDACRTQNIATDRKLRGLRAAVDEQSHGARTTYILAARRAGQLVGEVEALEHGVLTYVLLRGLAAPGLATPPAALALATLDLGADRDGDGIVTADELGAYADENVPSLVKSFYPTLVQRAGPGDTRPRPLPDADKPPIASDLAAEPGSFPLLRLRRPAPR